MVTWADKECKQLAMEVYINALCLICVKYEGGDIRYALTAYICLLYIKYYMKKNLFSIALLVAVLGMFSCSEKFDVAAPYKNYNVVYGLIDPNDTAHYIRIEKAFLDPNASALNFTKNPDSNYNYRIKVLMNEYDTSNPSAYRLISSTVLPRVDLNKEGYNKDTGTFFYNVNYAYKYKHVLNPRYQYRIIIRDTTTNIADSATTVIISKDTVDFAVKAFDVANGSIIFTKTFPSFSKYSLPVTAPVNTRMLEGYIRFNWVDSDMVSLKGVSHYADFNFANYTVPNPSQSNKITLEALNSSFYSFLASAMGNATGNYVRYMKKCNIKVYAGTSDFYNYVQVANTQSNGLTANEIKPVNTNIQGQNVLGIFTSRCTRAARFGFDIDNATLDSLKSNSITQLLKIQGKLPY
jgi:hypothetical protein